MNKNKLNNIMKEVNHTKKPVHWRKFINQNVINHNVILKCGKRAFCTNCQKYFDKDVVISSYKKTTCDWCNNSYYVQNCNKKDINFFNDIAFFTRVNDIVVLRIFEIKSKYNCKTRKFEHHLQEYARFIPNVGILINNTVSFFMWNIKIYHTDKITKWHIYTGKRSLYKMPIYPYNKKIFKGTPIEYAPIKEFKKEYPHYNDFELLELASYSSFELLWKMGLHRLSLSAKQFNKKGSFNKRFGLPKKYLKFMVENNLNYEEYRILKLIQVPDMELINKYRRFDYNYLSFINKQGFINDFDIVKKFYYDYTTLKRITKFVPLKKLLNYEKGLKYLYIYADYLEAAEKLNYSIKSKKRLFPKQLKARHDELVNKLEIMEDMNTQFDAYLRYLKLSKYTFEDNKYIIFPAPSVAAIKDEGKQQRNCVATVYLNKYIKAETEIYFIRNLDNPTKSFITLEYKNRVVVQKELPNHSTKFNQEQLDFIDAWCNFRKLIDKKEKYQQRNETQAKKYDLTKLVA